MIKVGDDVVTVSGAPQSATGHGVGTVAVDEDSFFVKYTVRWADGAESSVIEGDIALPTPAR